MGEGWGSQAAKLPGTVAFFSPAASFFWGVGFVGGGEPRGGPEPKVCFSVGIGW